ncbi:homoserine O-acetyltransferase [Brenneria izadpanahii]|uniref:Homoserine O-acetyltransferase n=1 Tax=Brenneria izadpanahii TaxID=2722756 RepID=A0ABX7UUY7_9GAMM|nr:homoserine O-acetyltransferase [Brenneria izadpanahii]QTF08167.1 homoserine O-acetyltransferase [Brenneria izadpanahii]
MTRHHFRSDAPFLLENGSFLRGIDIVFHTYGTLNADKSNVIWICHALTGSSDVAVWWPGLIGSGKCFDPGRWFIVCANVPGSPYGSTSPQSINPSTNKPYLRDFPSITIRDMVFAHSLLADYLGIERIFLLIGGSMGGQQALEWAICEPQRIRQMVILSANAVSSPWAIAFNESQRLALLADKTFDGIDRNGGMAGLKAARSIALLSYRCFDTYLHSQKEHDRHKLDDFLAAAYQRYQGEKFIRRFNAYCYWCLLNALDTHNIGRKRNKPEIVLGKVEARTLIIGIASDHLFPVREQKFLSQHIKGAQFAEIDSLYGHDGFLTETRTLEKQISQFLYGKKNMPEKIRQADNIN